MKKIIVLFFCVTNSLYSMQEETKEKITIKKIPFEKISQTKYQVYEANEKKAEIHIQKLKKQNLVIIKFLDDHSPFFGYQILCQILLEAILDDNKGCSFKAEEIIPKHWPYFDMCQFTSNKTECKFISVPDDNDKEHPIPIATFKKIIDKKSE